MKLLFYNRQIAGLTKIDVAVIVGAIALLICIAIPALIRARGKARSICCNCNLKQVDLAFKMWANDHTNSFPMGLPISAGGTFEYTTNGETFRHFQIMSNEINAPLILICPQDSRQVASDFGGGFSNSNVSYFVGLLANDDNPEAFLAGDRNIIGGRTLPNGTTEISTSDAIRWGTDLHNGSGNIALADGSVSQCPSDYLKQALQYTGIATNRLEKP